MSSKPHRQGFALPAVLAVTGVVTLVFLVAMTALASLTAEAASAKARVRFLQRAMTAEALVAYMTAVEPVTQIGFTPGRPRRLLDIGELPPLPQSSAPSQNSSTPLVSGEVRFDGRPYRIKAPVDLLVALQDQGGLINLAALPADQFERLGREMGLPAALSRQLASRYRDYVDADDLVSPGGAERSSYPSNRLPNRNLRRSSEWLSLLGVRSTIDGWKWRAARSNLAADHTAVAMNINSAPPKALELLFDLSPSQAQAALRARETTPFLGLSDLAAATGKPLTASTEITYGFPTGRVIYTLRDTQSAWTYRARLTMTPSGLEQPVWIDQTELTEAPRRAVADITDATDFPYAPR